MNQLASYSKTAKYLLVATVMLLVLFVYYAIVSPGCEGGMDSYNHYIISLYCWKYPYLMLDQWGKPLYSILASPFAHLGFIGVKIFNILLWLGTAWMVWLIGLKLELKHAWLGFWLVIIPQLSIENVVSGLTEYLNSFLLVVFIYLVTIKKWNLAALIAGLLPFARSEGFIISAIAGFYILVVEKQYKVVLWFLSGPLLFNTLGWIIEGDPLWIIYRNPYIKVQLQGLSSCGSGEFFTYINQTKVLFSLAGTILLLTGSGFAVCKMLSKNGRSVFANRVMFWLLSGVFFSYLLVHSYIWWKGMMGSCGYTRVMVVITPIAALLSVYGVNQATLALKRYRLVFLSLVLAVLLVSTWQSVQHFRYIFPLQISKEQQQFERVAKWLNSYPHQNSRKYFLYPYLNILCKIDPYDRNQFDFLWGFDFQYAPVGCLVIWDAHFGPNEGGIKLEELKSNKSFQLVKSFIPEEKFTTVNNLPFEIYIFKKVKVLGEK